MASGIFAVLISVLISFIMGAVAILFIGGRTTLKYLQVKASRGGKVLIFAKTKFGWKPFVGSKDQNTLKWKYGKNGKGAKKDRITSVEESDLTRFMRIDMVFIDADAPHKPIKLKEGQLFPDGFDPETFNNILIRVATRPTTDGFKEMEKLIKASLAIGVLILLGLILIYMKINELTGGGAGGVI